jgi:hypothetical protein
MAIRNVQLPSRRRLPRMYACNQTAPVEFPAPGTRLACRRLPPRMFPSRQEIAMSKADGSEHQGEGNRDAARHYNAASEKFARSGKVESAAKDAEKALEGPEKDELKRAEKEGRSHAKS